MKPSTGAETVGAAGATVSTVTWRSADAGDGFPAVSVAIAVNVCGPCARSLASNVHVLSALTTAGPRFVAPSKTATVVSAVVVPLITTVVPASASSAGEAITGAGGSSVSTTTATDPSVLTPSVSVAVTRSSWRPSSSSRNSNGEWQSSCSELVESGKTWTQSYRTAPGAEKPTSNVNWRVGLGGTPVNVTCACAAGANTNRATRAARAKRITSSS